MTLKKIGLIVLMILLMVLYTKTVYAHESYDLYEDNYPNEYATLLNEFTEEDYLWLARCTMCEAGRSNIGCAEGTVCIILNRVMSPRWPNTVKDVVNQPGQFVTKRAFTSCTPNSLVYSAIANVQNHGARSLRCELAEQGSDIPSIAYVFFATEKQSYAYNHIMVGIDIPGQKHWAGTEKDWSIYYE